ncbi:hypothetical protein [Burkholderia ubonensis]|uniref:hypothetical protein n=1 Tax=Burkholderia ubonensis TaxID=101571 RepID=UPI002FC5CD24
MLGLRRSGSLLARCVTEGEMLRCVDSETELRDQAMYEVKRSRPHRAQRNDVTA